MKLCGTHKIGKLQPRALLSTTHKCAICGRKASWTIREEDQPKNCSTCGAAGDCGGTIAKCVNCSEVEKRLGAYLKHYRGMTFVALLLDREKRNQAF